MEPTKQSNPKDVIGSTKLPIHLWPQSATAMGCLALMYGALLYGRSNFRHAGVRASVYFDACQRHLIKWFEGEDADEDSGLSHLAHALACLAILVDAQAAHKLTDDRNTKGGVSELLVELSPHVERLKKKYEGKQVRHYTIADKPL